MEVLVDVNVVFALVNERHAFHERACGWLDSQETGFRIGICRLTQMGLLRLLCNRAAMDGDPLTLPQAWKVFAELIGDPAVRFVHEPDGFQADWIHLCQPYGASPQIVSDAYLAAIAIRLKRPLATFDQDFLNFKGLAVITVP